MSMPPPPPPPGQGPPPHHQPYGNPYGNQWGGQYGGGQYAEHPQGSTILVLGILSLVVCAVLGPIAWSMGNKAIREMDAQPTVQFANRGNVTAGRICGIISTVLIGLGLVVFVIAIVAVAAGSSS
ncbi:MAG: DUF4190 domain-containing protein [Actinobacteria bacterium]|nr:DUF4190 domain-containing protein [Actinomycetota bacterium]